MPMTTMMLGIRPVSRLILKPSSTIEPMHHTTVTPTTMSGNSTADQVRKNMNRVMPVTIMARMVKNFISEATLLVIVERT